MHALAKLCIRRPVFATMLILSLVVVGIFSYFSLGVDLFPKVDIPTVQVVGTTIDDLQWSAVLRSVSGFDMYRKRYHGITIHRVVEFLVLDHSFPRAIRFCLNAATHSSTRVPARVSWPGAPGRNVTRAASNRSRNCWSVI